MKNDCGITKLSDADLFQEHDLLKTILYKSQYYEPDEEIQVHYDDFNNLSYFPHLSPDLDLNRIELILRRLKPYEIINTKDRIARYDGGTYFFCIKKDKLEELISKIENEVKGRKSAVNTRKVEFRKDTGETKYYENGSLSRTCTFQPNTNEYKVFSFFIENNKKSISYEMFNGELNKPRSDVDFPDSKRRIKDVIKAIRNKLGKNVIETRTNGVYIFDGEVIYP